MKKESWKRARGDHDLVVSHLGPGILDGLNRRGSGFLSFSCLLCHLSSSSSSLSLLVLQTQLNHACVTHLDHACLPLSVWSLLCNSAASLQVSQSLKSMRAEEEEQKLDEEGILGASGMLIVAGADNHHHCHIKCGGNTNISI